MTKLRMLGTWGGNWHWGANLEPQLWATLHAYFPGYNISKEAEELRKLPKAERLIALFKALPFKAKKLWLVREKRGLRPKRSRYRKIAADNLGRLGYYKTRRHFALVARLRQEARDRAKKLVAAQVARQQARLRRAR